MEQKRFLAAIIISAAILFAWQYFFSPPQPEQPAGVANTVQPQNTSAPPSAPAQAPDEAREAANTQVPDDVPQRRLVVETPLYRVTFDSHGAVPTSWIVKKNKDNGKELFSVGANVSERRPLELIPQSVPGRATLEAPLHFISGQPDLDAILNNRNYAIADASPDADTITLVQGEQRRLSFVMRDGATGTLATKTLVFDGDDYDVGLEAKVERNGGGLPVELSVGPSIGDQGVPRYTFYLLAPEAVFGADGGRRTASAIDSDKGTPGSFVINDPVDWVGIADTYFAMVVVPSQKFPRARFTTQKYEHEYDGGKEDRFLLNGFVPVPADGLRSVLYVGPKDNDLLVAASTEISRTLNRPIDLEGLIDYGYLSGVFRLLAIPIVSSLKAINRITQSYGLAIIIFTFIVYSLFFPLKWRSSKAMRKAQKMAPRMKELQEKMKSLKPDDPRLRELQMEQFRLMKEGNFLGGCLPLLIQMPFFIALYKAITISLDFRQATFLWLPDLSAADPLHLLPVLMAISILVVQLITPAPNADPVQRKMMAFVMPVMMLYFMWSAPAGLLVYWLFGNIVTFLQQTVINKLLNSSESQPPPQSGTAKEALATS